MATAATSLLGLALPVTGELSGTWGDTVNVSITALLDTAVAGTTTLSADADVTLTTTTLAANQARQAIILWTAGGTATRTITVPAQSKSYIVINKTSSSQSIKIVGVGPTTGVTIVAGTAAFVVWNGVDFVTASVTSTTGVLPVANGGTGVTTSTGTTNVVLSNSPTLVTPALGTPTALVGTNITGTAAAFNINGTVGATTPAAVSATTIAASGDINQSSASARLTYLNATGSGNGGLQNNTGGSYVLLYPSTHATKPNHTDIQGATAVNILGGGNIATVSSTGLAVTGALSATGGYNGTVGATTPTTGAFTTLSATTTAAADALTITNSGTTPASLKVYTGATSFGASIGDGPSGSGESINFNPSTNQVTINTSSASRGVFSSTGLAVTGALSYTTTLTGGTDVVNLGSGQFYKDASGNVGIGTSSPAAKLQVDTARAATVIGAIIGTTGTGVVGDQARLIIKNVNTASGQNWGVGIGGLLEASASNLASLLFYTDNGSATTERMRLDSSGNLLVGTTSAIGSGKISVSNIGGTTFGAFINATGSGIVVTSEGLSNTCTAASFRTNSGAVGSITCSSSTTYNTTSDYRLKTVIGPVANAGQRIDALQPVEYTWNASGERTRGFLAHQFQEVYAGSVTGNKDAVDAQGKPVYQAMQASTSEVIADLVAEIKSLRQRLAAAGI